MTAAQSALLAGLAVVSLGADPIAGQTPVIVWAADRPLTWADFRAKPVRQLDGARSAITHQTAVGCRNGGLVVRVQAVFIPDQSSVTYRIISSGLASRVGLAHEQAHFDLAELHARRIRFMFAYLVEPCPRSDSDLEKMVDTRIEEHWKEQERFERETRFGELEAVQLEWMERIARELAELQQYADGR